MNGLDFVKFSAKRSCALLKTNKIAIFNLYIFLSLANLTIDTG